MTYKVDYDGSVEEVKSAAQNCEEAVLATANVALTALATKTIDAPKAKELLSNLIKVSKDWGALNVIEGIIENSPKEDEANE